MIFMKDKNLTKPTTNFKRIKENWVYKLEIKDIICLSIKDLKTGME